MVHLDIKSTVKIPNVRIFGSFFSLIFAISSFLLYLNSNSKFANLLIFLTIILIATTIMNPNLLQPFNKLWYHTGIFLGKLTNPIIIGMIYFLFLTPIALFGRLIKRDVLILNKQETRSYWVNRTSNEFDLSNFKRQY